MSITIMLAKSENYIFVCLSERRAAEGGIYNMHFKDEEGHKNKCIKEMCLQKKMCILCTDLNGQNQYILTVHWISCGVAVLLGQYKGFYQELPA